MFELCGYVRQAFGALLLAFKQGIECLLACAAGLFSLLLEGLLGAQRLGQAIEVGLFQQGLLDLRCGFPLLRLCLGCRQRGALHLGLQLDLALAQFGLLLQLGADVLGQRVQLPI